MTEGIKLFEEKNYPKALENFLSAYDIDSTNANINYRIGVCYLNSASEKSKAVNYLKKAAELNPSRNFDPYDPNEKKSPKSVYDYLGQAYLLANDFDNAKFNFQHFQGELGNNEDAKKEIKKRIESAVVAKELTSNPTKIKISNMGSVINTPYPEYCPVINADESILIFTSRREGSSDNQIDIDGQYFEDIYMCKKRNGKWSSPEAININTKNNDAAVSMSASGQQLFIYKAVNGGDIYVSELEGDTWSDPVPLKTDETDINDINTPAWETHACMSSDGSTLYFVSNREGGYGGRDIYRCIKLPNGKWSKATNLGPTINTTYDEDAPFIHPDGVTLIFSSNGQKGMGGFDVFYSVKSGNWKWSLPLNMGSPLNTTDDDIFYTLSTDGKRAYYSSARPGGTGDKDLYVAEGEQAIVEPTVLLKGYLTFNGRDNSVANVRISAVDIETGAVVQEIKPNSKTGKYIMTLNPGASGKAYTINYEAEGFQPFSEMLKIEPGSAYQVIDKGLDLKSLNFESKTVGTIAATGTIKSKAGKLVPGAKIIVKNNNTGELVDTYFGNSTSGKYFFVLNRGGNFNLTFEAEGYLFHSENINTPKEEQYSQVVTDVILDPIEVGASVVLNNIFFDSNKSILRKESTVELEKLYQLLAEKPTITVEVSGHTDNKGDANKNMALSKARAQAVVDYLVNTKTKIYRVAPFYYKGIDGNRLISKGYGSSQPIAPNTLPNGKPDIKGMQMNRRVEFKIISTDHIMGAPVVTPTPTLTPTPKK